MMKVFETVGVQGDFHYWDSHVIKENRNLFHQKLEDYFENEILKWRADCSHGFMVNNIESGLHFLDNSHFHDRRTISKLFLRGFRFESVCGQWHKLDDRERICQYCINNMRIFRGDESHYLVDCPRFNLFRAACTEKLQVPSNQLICVLCNSRSGKSTSSFNYATIAKYLRVFDLLADPFCDST